MGENETRRYAEAMLVRELALAPLPGIAAAAAAGHDSRSSRYLAHLGDKVDTRWWLALVVAAQVLWIGCSAITNTALFPDVAEQFIWSKSLEWGYYKHPPLPTWLFASAISVFGPHPWVAGALSGLCLAATGVLTWSIAKALLGWRAAAFCLLFWTLQQPFSLRAYLYNHNVPLVLAVALTAWAALHAARRPDRATLWALAGAAAGAALLSKYQAAIPLLGLLWALFRSGALASPAARRGLVLATGVAFAVCAPHLNWLLQHDAPTLHYASAHVESGSLAARLANSWFFSVQQLRSLMPALICAGLWCVLAPRSSVNVSPRATDWIERDGGMPAARRNAWFEGLLLLPLLLVFGAALLGGFHLRAQWGMQTLQFAAIPFVGWVLARWPLPSLRQALAAALMVHVVGAVIVAELGVRRAQSVDASEHVVQFGQAQVIADAIGASWGQFSKCRLSYVVGDAHLAALVSAYSGTHPFVLEDNDLAKNPWIDPLLMRKAGAVYIATSPDLLPASAIHTPEMTLPSRVWRRQMPLVWGVDPPDEDCW